MKNQAAQWLINQRKSQNLSLRELGSRTGLTHTTIAKAEEGEASFETWKALAKYFDEDPQLVLSWAKMIDTLPEPDQWVIETQRNLTKLPPETSARS